MLKKYYFGIAILLVMIFATSAYSQTKIAYIDMLKIRETFQEFKDAEIKFQKEMESIQEKMRTKEVELENFRKEMEAQSMLLSEEKKAEKQRAFQEMVGSYQQYVQEEQGKAAQRQEELLAPIRQKLNIAIANVAKKEGFDYVLDLANTYYANTALDITNQVLREIAGVKLPAAQKK